MKILVVGGCPRTLLNFRGELLKTLKTRGHEVSTCAGGFNPLISERLNSMGMAYYPIRLARAGMNPLADLTTMMDLLRLVRRLRPDLVLTYTIKPNIYGAFAAAWCRVPAIYAMVEGLGYAFMPPSSLTQLLVGRVARLLYKIAIRKNKGVFFLNPDDLELFVSLNLVRPNQAILLNGTGVDLDYFAPAPLPPEDNLSFLLIARLLRDKGVGEYVAAARMIKAKHPRTKFLLAGELDPNPASITQGELASWIEEGVIDYLGFLNDVRPAIARSAVVVLPSYREGMPRSILEAMAMGRPIITTDAPGCRETIKRDVSAGSLSQDGIIKGENGFLVPVKDPEGLAYAMEQFVRHPDLVTSMGQLSREYAVERFDVHKVNEAMLEAMGLT